MGPLAAQGAPIRKAAARLCLQRTMKKIPTLNFEPAASREFEVIEVGAQQAGNARLKHPFRTDFFQILWFYEGSMTVQLDFEELQMCPGTVLLLNNNTVQSYRMEGAVKAELVLFTENFLVRALDNVHVLEASPVFNGLVPTPALPATHGLAAVWKFMLEEYKRQPDVYQSAFLQHQLHSFILLAEREISGRYVRSAAGVDEAIFFKFKRLVEQHFKAQKGVQYYCAHLAITEKRLNKATAAVVGLPAKQLIQRRVLLEAKRLLSSGSENVKAIGLELGFSEPTNFVKYFRKHTHTTPSQFRHQHHPARIDPIKAETDLFGTRASR